MQNMQKKILITGSKGQLASEFKYYNKKNKFKFIFADKRKLDISKLSHLKKFLVMILFETLFRTARPNSLFFEIFTFPPSFSDKI